MGLKLSIKWDYDILIHMAGNNKMSPFDIYSMLFPILNKNFDYVCGSRFYKKKIIPQIQSLENFNKNIKCFIFFFIQKKYNRCYMWF